MFYDEKTKFTTLLGVLEFHNRPKVCEVAARNFHALSFRLSGVTKFESAAICGSVEADQLVYTPAFVPYHEETGWDHVIVVHFEMEDAVSQDFEVFTPAKPQIYREYFTTLVELWQSKYPGYTYRAMSVFYKILEQMHREFTHGGSPSVYRKLKPAVTFIHENFTDPTLDIGRLCRLLSLSDTQFRKLFFEEFHTTPLRYINSLRIERATDLLEQELSVEETARSCGFADAKYFATVFKKYKGMPPSTYRR